MVINVVCYLARLRPSALPSLRLRVPRCRQVSPHRRGLPEPMVDTPRLHRLIRDIVCSAGPALQARLPITGPLLDVIHQSLSSPSFDDIMFWVVCCLAFFGFLRVAEFTCPSAFDSTIHLTATDVSIDPTSTIHLWLKSSKTDPFRQGFMIHIGSSGKPICPVAALRAYLDLRGHAPGPLFDTSTGSPLTPVIVNHWLRSVFTAARHGSSFSNHSFRIGAASSAASTGIPDHLIMQNAWPLVQPRVPTLHSYASGHVDFCGTCVMLIGWAAPFFAEGSRASNPSLQQAGGVAWERCFLVAQEHH